MHTKTSKQVLSPLAEAVSSLIVIISDSEITGVGTPDLSELSKAVDAQVTNLLNVAKKIASQPTADDTLKKDMPSGCDEVSHASRLLVSATEDLAQNPVSHEGRARLLESVKGILSGTTRILDVFDDSEVRRIVQASTVFRSLLNILKDGPSKAPQKEYIQVVSQTSQTIIALAQLATKRVSELLSNSLQIELQDAIRVLTKESPLLVSVCKMVLMNPDKPQVTEILVGLCDRLEQTAFRIEQIVQFRGEDLPNLNKDKADPIISERKLLGEAILGESFGDAFKRSPEETRKAYERFIDLSRALLKSLEEGPFTTIQNSVIKKQAADAIGQVSGYIDNLSEKTIAARITPEDPKLNHEIKALTQAVNNGFETLDCILSRGLVGQLISTLGNLSEIDRAGSTVYDIKQSSKNGDVQELTKSTAQFEGENGTLTKVVGHTVALLDQIKPQLIPQVHMYNSRVSKMAPAVQLASKILASNPSDPLIQEHLDTVLGSYTEAAKDMQKFLISQEGVFTAHDLIHGSKTAFDHHANALRGAIIDRDTPKMQKELVSTQAVADQFIAIVEKEIEFSEDPVYKNDLEVKLKVVQTVLPGLVAKAKALIGSKTGADSNQVLELDKIIENLSVHLSAISGAVVVYKGGKPEQLAIAPPTEYVEAAPKEADVNIDADFAKLLLGDHALLAPEQRDFLANAFDRGEDDQLKALTTAVKDIVIVNEVAPRRLSESQAQEDPLKAAGQELRVEASYWTTEENPIIAAVAAMSSRFLDLSQHHATLATSPKDAVAKRSFIEAAQSIMIESSNLINAAKPLLEAGTDKRLCSALQSTLTKIVTLAQQLKIIAAVKASSPSDADKGVQLVSCAQNLMQSVKLALRDCVSCSLRVRKDLPGTSAVIKFKKVIYAKDLIHAKIENK